MGVFRVLASQLFFVRVLLRARSQMSAPGRASFGIVPVLESFRLVRVFDFCANPPSTVQDPMGLWGC